jgi:DNA (cytosine-5)-methyltransferase 1
LRSDQLTEIQTEPPLNGEELRMNREAKEFHPVFNNMAFPDPLDEPSRTVTATCTRVSRESIVIADPRDPLSFRRLTIRERACLQGFPITYQLFAKSFSEKAKMAGNAIPPTFTYLLGLAAQGVSAEEFGTSRKFVDAGEAIRLPRTLAPVTPPDGEGKTYPEGRNFRAAIPHLRFKSGMRFDLSNEIIDGDAYWKVRFFFGSSKDIREVSLDGSITRQLKSRPVVSAALAETKQLLQKAENDLWRTNPDHLQMVWSHRGDGLHPYELTDQLAGLADEIHDRLARAVGEWGAEFVAALVLEVAQTGDDIPPSRSKLEKYALRIVSGFLVGDWFNTLAWHTEHEAAA